MEFITKLSADLSGTVWGWPSIFPLMVALLLVTGLFTTVMLRFIQMRRLKHSLDVIRGKYDDPEHDGDLSHFQALTTALSATVGIGNIAGVATALHYGGPGALFWMWVTAIFGMGLKYAECTLAIKYRVILPDGSASVCNSSANRSLRWISCPCRRNRDTGNQVMFNARRRCGRSSGVRSAMPR